MKHNNTINNKIKQNSLIIKMFLLIPLASLLIGCSSDSKQVVDLNLHYITTDSAPIYSNDKNAQASLSQSATSVSSSLQQLSAIQIATHPSIHMPTPLNAHLLGMAQQISVDWNGPVESILSQIAKVAHYKLNVLGTTPTIPVLVSVNQQNQTLAKVLRDVTFQIAKKASINIYPNKKIIELRYKQA